MLGILTIVAPSPSVGQDLDAIQAGLAAAEAAHRAGDSGRALALYDQVLTTDANNDRALQESARLLWSSWSRAEALKRYERVAALRPLDREETIEFATWLVDSEQAARALKMVSPIARQPPFDRAAVLAEGRALSGSGRRRQARRSAAELLAENPNDIDALNLMAASHHWGDTPEFAREWYERVLALDPENFAAQLGMSGLLARGDPAAARRIVDEMVQRHGRNKWIDGIDASLRGFRRPTMATGYYEKGTDADRFDVYFGQLSWDLSNARRLELTAASSRSRLGPPGTPEGTVQSGQAVWEFPVRPKHRLSIKGGLANRTDTRGESGVTPYGSATYAWGVGERTQGEISAGADPYVLALSTLGGVVDVVGVSANATRSFASAFSIKAAASMAKVLVKDGSDGDRWEARLDMRRVWRIRDLVPVEASYSFHHFEHPTGIATPGYFAPRRFTAHSLKGGVSGAVPPRLTGRRLSFSVSATYMKMAYGETRDTSLGGTFMAAFHLGNGVEIGALLVRSNGSMTVGWPAAVATEIGFGLRYVPPRR